MKKKEYHRLMTIHYDTKKGYFIEAGKVVNPTHKDEIYLMISGKTVQNAWELRRDEAENIIKVLRSVLDNIDEVVENPENWVKKYV